MRQKGVSRRLLSPGESSDVRKGAWKRKSFCHKCRAAVVKLVWTPAANS